MVDLNNVHGSSRGGDGNSETEEETTPEESAGVLCGTLDDGTNNDGQGTNKHANASAPSVDGGAHERESNDTTDLVHGSEDTSLDTVIFDLVTVAEVGVLEKVVDEGAVITIHRRAEHANNRAGIDKQHALAEGRGRLQEQRLVENLITGDDLLSEIFLLQLGNSALVNVNFAFGIVSNGGKSPFIKACSELLRVDGSCRPM
jgi:hypothetical protein